MLACFAVCLLACGQAPPSAPQPAPAFELPSLDGRSVRLSDFAGRVVVIDFWATWCTPCVVQIPILNAFHRAVSGQDVVVLGVSVDADGEEVVRPFAAEHGIEYTVLLGDVGVAFDYGAQGFPALAVVDPAGFLHSLHLGVITRGALDAAVRDARAQPAP